MTISLYLKITHLLSLLKIKVLNFFKNLFKNECGMGTVEVIIIIAVLVALALVFRDFIMDLAEMIFDKIKEKTDDAINTL